MRVTPRVAITACALALATLVVALCLPYSAPAEPTLPRRDATPRTAAVRVAALTVGSDRVSLETSSPSIVTGTSFGYSARVALSKPAENVRLRIQVRHPSGRLIFQRTKIFSAAEPGMLDASFGRGTDDLGLRPGVFPVELEVAITRDGATTVSSLATGLLVYSAEAARLDVSVVARVSGQPLSDSNGRFVADPERYTRARDDVHALAAWILAEPDARATLAIPPVLLEEWRRITNGYEFAGPEGVVKVKSQSAVARDYAATLGILTASVATGRLELASLGYSDPDLSSLGDAGLLGDVAPQYEQGLSATFASIESTPSSGTISSGACIPPNAAKPLVDAGIEYVVVDSDCSRTGDTTTSPSSYRTTAGLVALVPDDDISRAAGSGDASATVALAFARLIAEDAHGPLVIAVELGAGGAEAERLTRGVSALLRHPWARLALARDVAQRPKRTLRLQPRVGGDNAPAGYWSSVRASRRWSQALLAAVGAGDEDAVTALRASLISECSAWAGSDRLWALADRGRSFADTARRLATGAFDGVSLAVEPITLAGTTGDVPVTIRNPTDRTLNVRLEVSSSGGVQLRGAKTQELQLGPRETFEEIPVDLSNALTGRLRVSLMAGNVELDSASVTVRASYLDRMATVAGIVLILGISLAFIIRRVRAAERGESAATSREAYTEPNSARPTGGRR